MRFVLAGAALVAVGVVAVPTRVPPSRDVRVGATAVSLQQAPQARPTQPAQLPSVTLPAPLDRVLRDYEKAWSASDAAALAQLFADDGFVLQPGRAPVRGREAIRAAYTGSAGGALHLRALAYATDGAVGYIIGAYSYGSQPGDVGKFTLTLRRDASNRWLIVSDMDNGNTR